MSAALTPLSNTEQTAVAQPTSDSQTTQQARRLRRKWTSTEDDKLKELVGRYGDARGSQSHWKEIALCIPGRTSKDCRKRWFHSLDPSLRKGRWTQAEDATLLAAYQRLGPAWHDIALMIPGRKDDQCSKRYTEILVPSAETRLREWTPAEDRILADGVRTLGRRWSAISAHLTNRPPLTCRNRWRHLSERATVPGQMGLPQSPRTSSTHSMNLPQQVMSDAVQATPVDNDSQQMPTTQQAPPADVAMNGVPAIHDKGSESQSGLTPFLSAELNQFAYFGEESNSLGHDLMDLSNMSFMQPLPSVDETVSTDYESTTYNQSSPSTQDQPYSTLGVKNPADAAMHMSQNHSNANNFPTDKDIEASSQFTLDLDVLQRESAQGRNYSESPMDNVDSVLSMMPNNTKNAITVHHHHHHHHYHHHYHHHHHHQQGRGQNQ